MINVQISLCQTFSLWRHRNDFDHNHYNMMKILIIIALMVKIKSSRLDVRMNFIYLRFTVSMITND